MNYEKYKSQIEVPKLPSKPSAPKLEPYCPNVDDLEAHKREIDQYKVDIDEYIKDRAEYDNAMAARASDEVNLQNQFWEDAFKECRISKDHPLAEGAKHLAWENGHSAGYAEVMCHLRDIARLIEPLQAQYCVFPVKASMTASQRGLSQIWWEREGRASLTKFLVNNKTDAHGKADKA